MRSIYLSIVLRLGNNCTEPGAVVPRDWTRKPLHQTEFTDSEGKIAASVIDPTRWVYYRRGLCN